MITKSLMAGVMLCISAQSALATNEPEPAMLPIDAENIEFAGTWNYSTSNHQVSGRCPNGTPMAGTLDLTYGGGEVGLMVSSGATCNPGSMCMFSGSIMDGQLVVSNVDTVDDEGGIATNAMRIFFTSPEEGAGEVSSSYSHPDGFECQWSHRITLWRSDPDARD
ncbi:MAG: hypothetical protein QNJ44_02155 [Rhodobacter sp.]|nr:hypothetical protein [Rhodobacter sp.]